MARVTQFERDTIIISIYACNPITMERKYAGDWVFKDEYIVPLPSEDSPYACLENFLILEEEGLIKHVSEGWVLTKHGTDIAPSLVKKRSFSSPEEAFKAKFKEDWEGDVEPDDHVRT